MGIRDLLALKQRLKTALAWASEQEQELAERLQPQSLEDVDMLREKLTDALDELVTRRAELERQLEQANQEGESSGADAQA